MRVLVDFFPNPQREKEKNDENGCRKIIASLMNEYKKYKSVAMNETA